jgi:hypothetical protein
MKSGFFFLLGVVLFPLAVQSDEFHVKSGSTGSGMNGWSDAMGSIQGAIDLAAKTRGPDTIHVAGTAGATVNMFDAGGQSTTTPVTVFSNLDFYRANLITGNFAQANQSGIAADRGGDGIHVSVDSSASPGVLP